MKRTKNEILNPNYYTIIVNTLDGANKLSFLGSNVKVSLAEKPVHDPTKLFKYPRTVFKDNDRGF